MASTLYDDTSKKNFYISFYIMASTVYNDTSKKSLYIGE